MVFVRHGRTQWNAQKRFQGSSNIPLSDEGRAQARALAVALERNAFDAAFASDLIRAVETAKTVIGASHLELRIDPRLREFDFGAWEGLTWDEIVARWPDNAAATFSDALAYRPEGGESFDDVKARVAAFLTDLESQPYERVLVTTHAGVLHAALSVLAPRLSESERASSIVFLPASITRVTMDGARARLITVNDVSHFASSS